MSDDEIELGKAQGSVLASIIDLKNNGEITIDLSSVLDEDGGEYLGVSGAGKHTSSVNQIMSYYVKSLLKSVQKIMMDHWQL